MWLFISFRNRFGVSGAFVTVGAVAVLCLHELLQPSVKVIFPVISTFGIFIVMQKVQQIEAHESLTI
jgi:hypothetical protein